MAPWPIKRWIYRSLGWEVAPDARVGVSYIDTDAARIGSGVRVGHLNMFRGLSRLHLGDEVIIGNLNDVAGAGRSPLFSGRSFVVGERTQIMSRHYFDVAGRVTIGQDCTVAGRGSQFWSHSIFTRAGVPTLAGGELELGDGVYVGARSTIVHCRVPKRAVVGAGTVLAHSFEAEPEQQLTLVGNPARIVRVDAAGPDQPASA
jgi:acetyltransferase-like isoleucine patch superfamily enzyme